MISTSDDVRAAEWLLSPAAVREQAGKILAAGRRGELENFAVDDGRMGHVVDYVAATILDNYPDLNVPYHARWRHFVIDGVDRWAEFSAGLDEDPLERARMRIDLAVLSVLLDAGAGARWGYADSVSGRRLVRSEGLAIASLDGFCSGVFGRDAAGLPRSDAQRLQQLSASDLARVFQADGANVLEGLEGRAQLLNRLGEAIAARPQFFGAVPRIGHLADYFVSLARDGTVPAVRLLHTLLITLGGIWPGRLQLGGCDLGDCWQHPAARRDDCASGYVPFHKLSQWLCYSIVEPLEELGLKVTGLDDLTGLAEYRNGGLMVDCGLVTAKHDRVFTEAHVPGSEIIVEWRALTVALLDEIADGVRARFDKTSAELPLASVLEGGTWSAGRRIAGEIRAGGGPPISIVSDGSVF